MPSDEKGIRGEDGSETPVTTYEWERTHRYPNMGYLPILELVGQVLGKRGYYLAFDPPVPFFWYDTVGTQIEFNLTIDHVTKGIILIDTVGGVVHFEKWHRYGREIDATGNVERSNIADPTFSQWLHRLI
jgi:hypothetical protein